MKLIKHLLFTSVLFGFLTSCDPGVDYSKIIQNDSDYDILVTVTGGELDFDSIDKFYVKKHTVDTIISYGGLGQTFEFEDCNTFADSLTTQIIDHDSLILTLDLNNPSNWVFSIQNETFKSGGTCECRIILRNDQIE